MPSPVFDTFQESPLFNFPGQTQEQNGFNFSNLQNGYSNANGFVNYPDNDINSIFGMDSISDVSQETVTPEQLNLLRLAAQEIGGAQFTRPSANKFDYKYFNFEPNQRDSMPEQNTFSVGSGFNRPNSLNLDILGFNSNILMDSNPYSVNTPNNVQRYPNKFPDSFLKDQNAQSTHDSSNDLLAYLNQLNLTMEQHPNIRDDIMMPNNVPDYNKLQMDLNGQGMSYQNGTDESGHFNKISEEQNKMYQNFNRNNFQQMPGNMKPFNGVDSNFYLNEMMKQPGNNEKTNYPNQNFDSFSNTPSPSVPVSNGMNYKPNGYPQQNDTFMPRRDMGNQMMTSRDTFQNNAQMNDQRNGFDNPMARDNMQRAAMLRQNQELARQMSLLMRNRPPPNQLNVDVSFIHDNTFNMGKSYLAIDCFCYL